jgi:hypothetical protein
VRSVDIDDETYELISFAARAAGVTPAAIIARALAELRTAPTSQHAPAGEFTERPIYALYRGEEITAVYLPATRRVAIRSGSLAGRVFRTPSAAASAVVAALNPGREMSRINGLRFWRDAVTGGRLDTLSAGPGEESRETDVLPQPHDEPKERG